jgi:hypothetical protein
MKTTITIIFYFSISNIYSQKVVISTKENELIRDSNIDGHMSCHN